MKDLLRILTVVFIGYCGIPPESQAQAQSTPGPLSFERKWIASEAFESVNVFDVNGDGQQDILSGSFWYEGPAHVVRHPIGALQRFNEYFDDFSTIVLDVNKDGKKDVITGGWFKGTLLWKENPGKEGTWKEHVIARCGNIETTRAWDLDGDGTLEIIPNTPGKPLVIYQMTPGDSSTFKAMQVMDKHGHGLGYGDINGDGRGDLIVAEGWLECPPSPFTQPWKLHPEFTFVQASIPMLAADVNGDGLTDLMVGQGHDYGLSWYEQGRNTKQGRTWIKHSIDANHSQFHTMEWNDLDNDGRPELITGKRYRAHDDHDPGAHDPVGLYYYQWNGESFTKQVISFGPAGSGKGTGIFFAVSDLNGDGWKDVVVAGKDGLCAFVNQGVAR
jgi:hypothetical protein